MTEPGNYAGRAEDQLAEAQLAEAQQVLDLHATSSANGRCLACGTIGPCCRRETAVVIFSRYLRMPRRIPGATQPELVTEPKSSATWFACQASVA